VPQEHYFFAPWTEPSIRKSRTVRWLGSCKELLAAVFIDTLIFGTWMDDENVPFFPHSCL
jgi:hypothetical protein